nr:uncharacterized protein CI109_002906 [Kwoniella shandongensis]KAA5528748.1 hypothetical protein CI109_002906 [Kwoniella shandongensis]
MVEKGMERGQPTLAGPGYPHSLNGGEVKAGPTGEETLKGVGRGSEGSIVRPHFAERPISVRRLSVNPNEPDRIDRINSVSSTIHDNPYQPDDNQIMSSTLSGALNATNPSMDLRNQSQISTSVTNAFLKRSNGQATTSVDSAVVDVGERRPSLLSVGDLDSKERGSLSVRRISAGGIEDVLVVKGISADEIPSNTWPLVQREPGHPAHPYSSESLSRTSIVGRQTIPFPEPHINVPYIRAPPAPESRRRPTTTNMKKHRPDSLTLVQSFNSSDKITSSYETGATVTSFISNRAIKSASTSFVIATPDEEEEDQDGGGKPTADASKLGINSIELVEPTTTPTTSTTVDAKLFEAWRGFPPKMKSANPIILSQLPLRQPSEGIPSIPNSLEARKAPFGNEKEREGSTTSTSYKRSSGRITNLADLVKQNQQTDKPTRSDDKDTSFDANSSNVSRRQTIVSERPPIISPLELDPNFRGGSEGASDEDAILGTAL